MLRSWTGKGRSWSHYSKSVTGLLLNLYSLKYSLMYPMYNVGDSHAPEESPAIGGEGEERMMEGILPADHNTPAVATIESVRPETSGDSSSLELSQSDGVSHRHVAVDSLSSSPSTFVTCESTTGSSVLDNSVIEAKQLHALLPTYILVGDNIDREIAPREM